MSYILSSTHTCVLDPVMPTLATMHLRARAMQLCLLLHHLPHATILQCQDLTILPCITTKLVDYACSQNTYLYWHNNKHHSYT